MDIPAILVVDDSKAILAMIKTVLDKGGYETDTSEDGLEAIGKIKRKHYDLIISDYHMPGMDGVRLVKAIRRRKDYTDTPILILSGDQSQENHKLFQEIGANGWLQKPVDAMRVLTAVASKLA